MSAERRLGIVEDTGAFFYGFYNTFRREQTIEKYEAMIRLASVYGMNEQEAESLLKEYTKMPGERRKRIAQTIEQKIEYLRLFQQGKQIWKREQYW